MTGTAKIDGISVFALMRYCKNGMLDYSFGQEGIVTSTISQDNHSKAHAALVQCDGKIIVAGFSNKKLALVRYHENGLLDEILDCQNSMTLSENDSKIVSLFMKPDSTIALGVLKNERFIILPNEENALNPVEETTSMDPLSIHEKPSAPPTISQKTSEDESTIKEALEFYKKHSLHRISKWQVLAEGAAVAGALYLIVTLGKCCRLMYIAGRITGVLSPRKIRQSLRNRGRQIGFTIDR